jgi:hypothetical protein
MGMKEIDGTTKSRTDSDEVGVDAWEAEFKRISDHIDKEVEAYEKEAEEYLKDY